MITAFFILCGTVIIAGTALVVVLRRQFNRDKARWAARFARPLTLVHPGEPDIDEGVSGDSIARMRRSQRKLDAARDRKLTEGIEKILSEADGNG